MKIIITLSLLLIIQMLLEIYRVEGKSLRYFRSCTNKIFAHTHTQRVAHTKNLNTWKSTCEQSFSKSFELYFHNNFMLNTYHSFIYSVICSMAKICIDNKNNSFYYSLTVTDKPAGIYRILKMTWLTGNTHVQTCPSPSSSNTHTHSLHFSSCIYLRVCLLQG